MKEELIDVRKRINHLMGDEEEKQYAKTYYEYEHYHRKLPGYVPETGPPRQSFKHGLSVPMELDRYVVTEERQDDYIVVDSYRHFTGQTSLGDQEFSEGIDASLERVVSGLFDTLMDSRGAVMSEDDMLVYMQWVANSLEEELFQDKEPTKSRADFVRAIQTIVDAFDNDEQTDTSN